MWNDSEFNSTFSSPGGGGAAKENKFKNLIKHIIPVTGHTITECSQVEGETSLFELNQLKFHQVCYLGIIRNVIKRTNDTTYVIDDMTTPSGINVKLQSDEKPEDDMESVEVRPAQPEFIENQYVRVYGVIKSLQGQKNLQAFKILPVKELNEITYHMLQCINASIHYLGKANGANMGEDSMDMMGNGSSNSGSRTNSNNAGLTTLQAQISSLIKGCKNEGGIHKNTIFATFSTISQKEVMETLDFLSSEGHIYATIEEDLYKTTDGI
jgi:replication factor A2